MTADNIPEAPAVDLAAAARFFDVVAEGEAVTFQTFDDGPDPKRKGLAQIEHGDVETLAARLSRLNLAGAGIFWMVNRGDGEGRASGNVTGVRALFVDLDGAPLQPVLAAGVEPHAVVESSPGRWHVYWLTKGCELEQFKPAQKALAAKFGGDPSVCDLPRVMRVPGFLHRKGEPFQTRVHSLGQFQPYPFDELVRRLGLELEAPRQEPAPRQAAPGKVTPGNRHAHLVRRAGELNWRGMCPEAILEQLRYINEVECDPPKPDAELQTIAADIVRRYSRQHGQDLRAAQESEQTPPADGADEWDVHHNAQATAPALGDFYAHLPSHSYLYVPTRELWPSSSVNGCGVPWPKVQTPSGVQKVAPSRWLDKHRAVQQMAWHPGEPLLIRDKVLQVSGWAAHPGAAVFNLYRPPQRPQGDASKAGPWLEHVRRVFPDDAAHLIDWLAYKAQHPGDKINHAIVLGGQQGIGKDTLLEPVKAAVGAWNWQDVTPTQMLGRFNGWAKAVIVRINEARDLGDVDRFAFYDHSKALIAAPPDVIRVDEKHLRETYVANVCGVVITTNHLGDGLYLPADDRRHFVAWSALTKDDFDADYWRRMYRWLATGGTGHVCDFLATRDLSGFDPKAPPPKTAAFWAIVAAGEAPESGELRDLIDDMGTPPVLTLSALVDRAQQARQFDLADELKDRKSRRAIPHRLERVGYVPVRNPDADDGLFKIAGKRQAVYAQRRLTVAEQVKAARKFAAQSA
jgi:hypothetical protein